MAANESHTLKYDFCCVLWHLEPLAAAAATSVFTAELLEIYLQTRSGSPHSNSFVLAIFLGPSQVAVETSRYGALTQKDRARVCY